MVKTSYRSRLQQNRCMLTVLTGSQAVTGFRVRIHPTEWYQLQGTFRFTKEPLYRVIFYHMLTEQECPRCIGRLIPSTDQFLSIDGVPPRHSSTGPARGGGGRPPFLTPPLNQKFSATPKICLKLCSSSKIVDFTTFFLKFLINFWISILKWPKTDEFWFFWGGLVCLVLFNIGSGNFRPPLFRGL